MKLLNTNYHSQLNNKILPYSTCGVTSLANYLDWLSLQSKINFEHDDDKLMQILNNPELIAIGRQMIASGLIDKSALDYRSDNSQTPDVNESNFTHLNNFIEMLGSLGNYITKHNYIFGVNNFTNDEIKNIIDNNNPVLIGGKFTASGHFVLIVGYDDIGNWIIDDPYGDYNTGYSPGKSGAKVLYNQKNVLKMCSDSFGIKIKCLSVVKIS